MPIGTTGAKLFPLISEGVTKLRNTKGIGSRILTSDLQNSLNKRFGSNEVGETLGYFFGKQGQFTTLDELDEAVRLPKIEVETFGLTPEQVAKESDILKRTTQARKAFDDPAASAQDLNKAEAQFKEINEIRAGLQEEIVQPKFAATAREFPEGTNYADKVYKLDKNTFIDPHFEDVEGVFANTRTSLLDAPEGSAPGKVHMIEEMQSGQVARGQRQGFIESEAKLSADINDIERLESIERRNINAIDTHDVDGKETPEFIKLQSKINSLNDERDKLLLKQGKGVPDVPFKKSWPTFLFKQELEAAAKNPDIKYIAWPTSGVVIKAENAHIGSDTAKFMEGLYDKHLPKEVTKYVKQWDVTPQISQNMEGKRMWIIPITHQMRTDVLTKGQPVSLKSVAIATGAGAAGALMLPDLVSAAEAEVPTIGAQIQRQEDDDERGFLKSALLISAEKVVQGYDLIPSPIKRGVGVAFGLLNVPYAATWALAQSVEELNKAGITDGKARRDFAKAAIYQSIQASALKKGDWGIVWADYFRAVTGKTPQEHFGKVKGTILDIGISIIADPLLPVDIFAPVAIAVKARNATKARKLIGEIPGFINKYGSSGADTFTKDLMKLTGKQRNKFFSKAQEAKEQGEKVFTIGLPKTTTKVNKPKASLRGTPIQDIDKGVYRASMADPARGNAQGNQYVLREAGIKRTEYLDQGLKARREAQKKIAKVYEDLLDITETVKFTPTKKLTQAVVSERGGIRLNIAENASPLDVVHEVMHTKDFTRGFYGSNENLLSHFENVNGNFFGSDFIHQRVVKNALTRGENVSQDVLMDYRQFDWARAALGLDEVNPAAIPPLPPGIRKLVEEDQFLREAMSTFGNADLQRTVVSDAELANRARALLDDPDAIDDIWARMGSGKVDAAEIEAGRIDLAQSLVNMTKTWDPDIRKFDTRLSLDYQEKLVALSRGASESGRALRVFNKSLRRFDVLNDEIRMGLGGTGLEEVRRIAETGDSKALGAFFAKNDDIFTENVRLKDFVVEYYINNLLSTTSAQATNFLSNLMFGTYNIFIKHPMSGVVDLVRHSLTGAERAHYFGEFAKEIQALPKSIKQGAKAGALIITKGEKAGLERIGLKWEVKRSAIEGTKAPAVVKFVYNGALRFMMGADVLFRTSLAGANMEALAFRQSKKFPKGKTFEELIKDPPAWMIKQSKDFANKTIFFDEPGELMSRLLSLKRVDPTGITSLVVPFAHTYTKILARGLEMTPVIGAIGPLTGKTGDLAKIAKAESKLYKSLSKIGKKMQASDNIADATKRLEVRADLEVEQMRLLGDATRLASDKGAVLPEVITNQLMGLAITGFAYNKWAKGNMTGARPIDIQERKRWGIEGITPYSLKVAGKWFRYNDILGPFGVPMAMAADLFNELETIGTEGDKDEIITTVGAMTQYARDIGTYITEQSFMRSLMKGVDSYDRDEPYKLSQYVGNLISGFVPYSGLLKQLSRARESVVTGGIAFRDSETVMQDLAANFAGIAEMFGADIPLKFDYRGRPRGAVESTPLGEGSVSAVLAQMFPFMKGRESRADAIDNMFIRAGYFPDIPSDKINKVRLTPEFMNRNIQIRGEVLEEKLQKLLKSDSWKRLIEKHDRGSIRAEEQIKKVLRRNVTKSNEIASRRLRSMPDVQTFLRVNRVKREEFE